MSSHAKPWLSFLRRHSRKLTVAAAIGGTAIAPIAAATAANASADTAEMHIIPAEPTSGAVAAQPVSAPVTPVRVSTYTVLPGDNLWNIAGQQLGDHSAWRQLFDANRGKLQPDGGSLTNPDLIQPGWVLDLPSAGSAPSSDASGGHHHHHGRGWLGSAGNGGSGASQGGSGGSGASQTGSDGLIVPVIAPDSPGTPSGYAAHDPSFWAPLIEQAKQLVGVDYSTEDIEGLMASESSGDPNSINNYDSNAAAGTPSEGLMQVIQPTFDANHVPGTSENLYDPLANIAAALQYIKTTYGYVPSSPY